MKARMLVSVTLLSFLLPSQGQAQTAADMMALEGLAPVAALLKTDAGKAALGANFTVTGHIQSGEWRQPTLLPFAEQQQQALRDVFSTRENLAQLADGLGTTLGSAYLARAHFIDRKRFTSISQNVADIIAYAVGAARSNSSAGKDFFGNLTADGKKAVSTEARAILDSIGGTADIFGQTYRLPAGSEGSNAYGNSRPFQTEPVFVHIVGRDYFGAPADNTVYNKGPMMDLINSPSYPSGHTAYGYAGSLLLALMVPERYPELIVRGADYGNNRIIVGAHYAMDVLGGRAVALHAIARLLANDPAYVGQRFGSVPVITDFRAALSQARTDVRKVLEDACGKPIAECALEDTGRLSDAAANEAFYASTQTYGLPMVHAVTANTLEDVGKLAPEAGYLLTVAFPSLPLEEANRILTLTLGPGGGFLNNGSAFGIYSRLNLYAASRYAMRQIASERGR